MQHDATPAAYRSGEYLVVPAMRQLLRGGCTVDIEAKVFDLILLLASNAGRAIDKRELVAALWGQRPISDAAVSQLVYKARRACGDDGSRQAVIRTIHGHGLQWMLPVHITDTEDAPQIDAAPQSRSAAGGAPGARRRICITAGLLFALVVAIVLLWLPRAHAPLNPRGLPTVAVLPLQNATGDASLDWISHGLPGLLGSLLNERHGVRVVDPLQMARAWTYDPIAGESRAAHVRMVTGATTVVEGHLQRLGELYELHLRVETGEGRPAADIRLAGTEPAALAVAALPQLRVALRVPGPIATLPGVLPDDSYLAQSFARGMDAAMHGRWAEARPYFRLVEQGDAAFLPALYRLGQAQVRTGDALNARKTLQRLLDAAVAADAPALAALALKERAYEAMLAHAFADAVAYLREAQPFARRAGDAGIEIELTLHHAQALARLGRNAAAADDLERARRMLARNPTLSLQRSLQATEIFITDSRSDYPALELAARASLTANRAVGDARGAMAAIYNLAYALENQGRRVEALPLWARVVDWAHAHDDTAMGAGAGWYLAGDLFHVGLDERAAAHNDALLRAAKQRGDASILALALRLRAEMEWLAGDPQAAQRSAHAASKLPDATNDPQAQLDAWLAEAFFALEAQPDAVVALAETAQDLIKAQPDAAAGRQRARLLQATAAAAAGNREAARAALAEAWQTAGNGLEAVDVQRFAAHIALRLDDAAVGGPALHALDPESTVDAVLLELLARHAARVGDAALAGRVAAQRRALHEAALQALDAAEVVQSG